MEIPEFKGSFVVENHGTPQPKQNAILVMPLVLASNKSLLLVSELYTTLVRDIKYIEKITINTEAYCARDYIESCAESFLPAVSLYSQLVLVARVVPRRDLISEGQTRSSSSLSS